MQSHVESNNNIGTIYVERVDAGNNAGTLNYTTGISGTQGIPNADGTINDTQNIVVNTNSATLNINGAGGVDKFNIEASSFTKTLTIAGNLGTVPNYEEANNNYDTVRIDLSKTSGVNLDISKLLVSNPNNEGIVITASKGADNIILTAGANHDVVEFSAGGGTTGQAEVYELDLGNLRLGQGQSVTIDGLTITNISGFSNGGIATNVNSAAVVLTAEDIATILAGYMASGDLTVSGKFGGVATATAASKFVSVSGELASLAGNGWTNASGAISATASSTKITITNSLQQNVTDIDLTTNISGNGRTNGLGGQANTTPAFVEGKAAINATASGTATQFSKIGDTGGTSAKISTVTFNIDGTAHTIEIQAASSKEIGATALGNSLYTFLTTGAFGSDIDGTDVKVTKIDGTAYNSATADASALKTTFGLPTGFAWYVDSTNGKISITATDTTTTNTTTVSIAQTGDATMAAYTFTGTAYSPATQGDVKIDFGNGLLAGQSYTFLGKTVLATKDLTGEQIAEAFAFGDATSSGVDGAVVVGAWGKNYSGDGTVKVGTGSAGIDPSQVLFDISGSSLILQELTPGVSNGLLKFNDLAKAGVLNITGTGTLAVRTDGITGSTTKQGQSNGEAVFADSYVTFSVIGGSAPSGAGSAGVATVVKANTSALDTITNFDVSTDKLLLKKFDASGAEGARYANSDAFSGSSTDAGIFVDTAGSTLGANAANGIISFTTASTSELTLEQKLYAASVVFKAETNSIGGFEHNGDFYVIANGGNSGSTTDDLVIKLTGVSGITDIGAILA